MQGLNVIIIIECLMADKVGKRSSNRSWSLRKVSSESDSELSSELGTVVWSAFKLQCATSQERFLVYRLHIICHALLILAPWGALYVPMRMRQYWSAASQAIFFRFHTFELRATHATNNYFHKRWRDDTIFSFYQQRKTSLYQQARKPWSYALMKALPSDQVTAILLHSILEFNLWARVWLDYLRRRDIFSMQSALQAGGQPLAGALLTQCPFTHHNPSSMVCPSYENANFDWIYIIIVVWTSQAWLTWS